MGKSVSGHVVLHLPRGMQNGPGGAGSRVPQEPRAGDVGGAGRVSGRTASGRRADPEVDTGVRQEVTGSPRDSKS